MNPIDDMFRDGLGGRKGEVPADMWSRVSAGKVPVAPEGEGVDRYFADALKDRAGNVPADMWNRIAAAGVPATAGLDEAFSDALRYRKGKVPKGMWDRIWKARTAAPLLGARRIMAAAAVILLLLSFGWWLTTGDGNDATLPTRGADVFATDNTTDTRLNGGTGSAAGAVSVEEEGLEEIVDAREPASTGTETASPQPRKNDLGTTENREETNDQVPAPTRSMVPVTSASDSESNADVINQRNGASLVATANTSGESTSRVATIALPVLNDGSTIDALEIMDTWDFKVKKRYQPKTPPANRFRSFHRNRLQTEFLFGAFYANQQFSAETADQRAQRNIREVRENPGLSYQVSLRGAYKLNDRLLLRSGLTYSEIRNKFDYERTVNGVSSLITINNQIRQLEVPVLLGLRIPGRRINVSLNAGPLVNLTTNVQGLFLQPDSVEPLSLSDNGQYRRNVGVGFMTSLSTIYVIGKKQPFVLLVEPFIKAYPGSFMRQDAPLKEKYWAAGLQLGVRKGF